MNKRYFYRRRRLLREAPQTFASPCRTAGPMPSCPPRSVAEGECAHAPVDRVAGRDRRQGSRTARKVQVLAAELVQVRRADPAIAVNGPGAACR